LFLLTLLPFYFSNPLSIAFSFNNKGKVSWYFIAVIIPIDGALLISTTIKSGFSLKFPLLSVLDCTLKSHAPKSNPQDCNALIQCSTIKSHFPGIVEDGETSIKMEVYRVSDEQIKKRLDYLEGYYGPKDKMNLYNKIEIDTPYGKAFTYTYNGEVSKRLKVESGDWVDYKRTLANTLNQLQNASNN